MKILSISDVITNSSSEVFCTIKSDDESVLMEIKEALTGLGESDWGDGGTYLDIDEKYISVDFAHDAWNCGLDMLFKAGIEKLLEPWKGKYIIEYGE